MSTIFNDYAVIYDNVNLTGTNNSSSYNIDLYLGYSVQLKWTTQAGTPTGTIRIQVSNEDGKDNWDDIGCSIIDITTVSNILYNLGTEYYRYFRLNSDISGGTITLFADFSAKGKV